MKKKRIITVEQFQAGLKICKFGKHKLRVNSFGVTWCVRCGLLSNSVGEKPLEDHEALTVK